MGRCSWDGFIRDLKLVITYLVSHVGLCACVVGYLIAGAYLFRWLEQQALDQEQMLHLIDPSSLRNKCISHLYNMTERASSMTFGNVSLVALEWRQEAEVVLMDFETQVKEAVESGNYETSIEDMRRRWNFIGSLFYCVTVITTIGYGHVAPQTWQGKMTTIVYAVFGIPLMLLCLTNIGDSMARTFRFTYSHVCCFCLYKEPEEYLPPTGISDHQSNSPGEPPPWVPPPRYKPSRRNMLISPPISATIHRGSDDPLTVRQKNESLKESASDRKKQKRTAVFQLPPGPISRGQPRLNELDRLINECTIYNRGTDEGSEALGSSDARRQPQPECDQPFTNFQSGLNAETTGSSSLAPSSSSTPSSPLSIETPTAWDARKEMGGALVRRIPDSSPSSTTPTSPNSVFPQESSFSFSGRPSPNPDLQSVAWSMLPEEDHNPVYIVPTHPKRSVGKNLVVYNTLSGDALLEQSKIQRKMALMSKGGLSSARNAPTTVFTDPVSGQAVNGDMFGLTYRPIAPEPSDSDTRVPITVVLAFVSGYLGIGSLPFGWLEGWAYLDAGYFCFITLSTIGFGDFVPGKSLGYETLEAQVKLVTGSLYLLLGLAVLAMSFSLVQEEVILKCKSLGQRIGLLKA